MSDKSARRRSLESLKKEARRWLDALRQNLPDARTRFERAVPSTPSLFSPHDTTVPLASAIMC